MNFAQALGIAAATTFYVLTLDEPWSVRYAEAHAHVCEAAAEAESLGVQAFAEPERFLSLLPMQTAELPALLHR